jgi:PHD/YefM family antitoxin component YafN of YafNO toxin-antitoxin module
MEGLGIAAPRLLKLIDSVGIDFEPVLLTKKGNNCLCISE